MSYGKFYSYKNGIVLNPFPGLTRKILANNDKIMLVENRIEKEIQIPEHKHISEQLTYIQKGKLLLYIEDKEYEMVTGDSIIIQSDMPHRGIAVEDSIIFDYYSPPRIELFDERKIDH